MRVLLVCPEFPQTYWGFEHALALVGKRCAFPPLGLMTVAAMLPQTWEKRLIDLNVADELTDSDIEWAEMVFVTGMLIQKDAMRRVQARSKALGKIVVVGGTYVSTTLDEITNADHIFIGETEATLPEFFRDLELGQARRVYEAPERPKLTLTPRPDYSLIDMEQYGTMSLQYSRGCPFHCEFCDIIVIYGNESRTKDNSQVLADLDSLYNLGWRGSVFIVDDNFIGNKKNARTLLPFLVEWQKQHGFPFSFFTEASVNLAADEPFLAQMQAAGFHKVFPVSCLVWRGTWPKL